MTFVFILTTSCAPIRQGTGTVGGGFKPEKPSKDVAAAKVEAAAPSATPQPGKAWEAEMEGLASWYGKDFNGHLTASGEVYDMYGMTAAHKTLPLQTIVKVHHLGNGKTITVRINDRGPFVKGRVIDLSRKAAKALGMREDGTAKVRLEVKSWP